MCINFGDDPLQAWSVTMSFDMQQYDTAAIGERHRDEADFLSDLREVVVHAHGQNLECIQRLDDRLDANLDGIRLAADKSLWVRPLDDMMENPGMVFIGAVLGAWHRDVNFIGTLLESTTMVPSARQALIAGLGWVPRSAAHAVIRDFITLPAYDRRCFSVLAICSAHRLDPGPLLLQAMTGDDRHLVAQAFRTAGELGRYDLVGVMKSRSGEPIDTWSKFEAYWSLALFKHTPAARELFAIAQQGAPMAEHAAELAARCLPPGEALSYVKALNRDPFSIRAFIWAAAALGDPALIDLLIERMGDPSYSRLAGWAFGEILGVDLHQAALVGGRPTEFVRPGDDATHADIRMDPEAPLPFPIVERAAAYFHAHRREFQCGTRISRGNAVCTTSSLVTLMHGNQPARRGAALELRLQLPTALCDSKDGTSSALRGPLFPVCAPARRQRQLLAQIRKRHGGDLVGNS